MMWYLLGIILSLIVFFFGSMIGMPVVLKWTVIALVWAGAAHMDMKTKAKEKDKDEKVE